MSFLSGNTKSMPEPPQAPLGLQPESLASNQASLPLPVIKGGQAVGVKFITQAFDRALAEERADTGKDNPVIGYHYFASFAALVCHGPVDKLNWIEFDGALVWPPAGDAGISRDLTKDKLVRVKVISQGSGYGSATTLSVGGGATVRPVVKDGKIIDAIVTSQGTGYDPNSPPGPGDFTLGTTGGGTGATFTGIVGSETFVGVTISYAGRTFNWRLYWGMEDTDYDYSLLTLSGTKRNPLIDGITPPNVQEEHPAYAGQCYLVAVGQYLGYQKTQVQNIRVNVSRFPVFDWIDADPQIQDDVNPIVSLAEDLTNKRYGLGLAVGRLAQDVLNATSLVLEQEGLGFSPLVTNQTTVRAYLKGFLEYFDGYQYTTAAGLYAVGLVRKNECSSIDPDSPDYDPDTPTPYYDEACLVRPPKINPLSWDQTTNYVYVNFTNRFKQLNEDCLGVPNLGNFQVTGEQSTVKLDRPWFTRPDLVDTYTRAAAQILGLPEESGTVVVRKSKLQGAVLGGIFKLKWGHWRLCYEWLRIKAITIADPYDPIVTIDFVKDRGYLTETVYTPPAYNPPTPIVHSPEEITVRRLVEMPFVKGAADPTGPRVLALAQRPTNFTTEMAIVLVSDDSGQILQRSQGWASHGTLDADYLKDNVSTMRVLMDGIDKVLSIVDLDAADETWLAFVNDEIFVITDAEPVGGQPDKYDLTLVREKYDSARADHSAADQIFIIKKVALRGAMFLAPTGTDRLTGTIGVKLQPFVLGNGFNIASVTEDFITFTGRAMRMWKPRQFAVNGTPWYNSSGPTWSTGDDILVEWSPNNRNVDVWEDDLPSIWFLELQDSGGTPINTWTFAADVAGYTITNDELLMWITDGVDFKLKLYAESGRDVILDSRHFDEAYVTFV